MIADNAVEGNEMFGRLGLAGPCSMGCDAGLSTWATTEQKYEASLATLKSHLAWWHEARREYATGMMLE